MARYLHGRSTYSPLGHGCQQRLQIRRLWCRQLALDSLASYASLDAADQPSLIASRAQPGLKQVAGGGLARRTGDTDQQEPGGRLAIDPGGDFTQPGTGIADDKHWQPGPDRGAAASWVSEY